MANPVSQPIAVTARRIAAAAGLASLYLGGLVWAAAPAGARSLICDTPPGLGDPHAAPHRVRVLDVDGARPVIDGPVAPVATRLYLRGRTHVFDAVSEVLYFDRDNHRFAYTFPVGRALETWRGTCRVVN